jgi:hypothetical protein
MEDFSSSFTLWRKEERGVILPTSLEADSLAYTEVLEVLYIFK